MLRLDRGGFPLGLFQDATYEQQTLPIGPGDALVFYTDGVTETRSPNGEEFGTDRLTGIASSRKGLSSRELQEAILDEIMGFSRGTEPDDDLTLLVVKAL